MRDAVQAAKPTTVESVSLSEALSTIDAWGIDAASLLEMACDEQRAKPKMRHETRRRLQKLQLREQLDALELVIETEREKRRRCELVDGLRVECEQIVSRQCRARFSAQVENTKLRKALQGLYRDAVKIKRLGHRLLALKNDPCFARPMPLPQYRGPSEDPQIHLLRLNYLSQETASIFSSGAFASHHSERLKNFRSVVVRDRKPEFDNLEVVFEIAWVLPFSVENVADALWIQTTRIATGNNHVRWTDLLQDSASRVSQFVSTSVDPTDRSVKCGQLAARRETLGDERVLFVSNLQVHAQDTDRAIGSYSNDVWIRVEAIQCSDANELSQVLWCRRIRMSPPELMCKSRAKRSQWIHSIITGTMRKREESILNFNIQAVENRLFDTRKRTAASILLVH